MLISNNDQVLTKRVYNSDETVLWEGEAGFTNLPVLFDSYKNYEYVKFIWQPWTENQKVVSEFSSSTENIILSTGWMSTDWVGFMEYGITSSDGINFTGIQGGFTNFTGSWTSNTEYLKIYKVVGINRKEGN